MDKLHATTVLAVRHGGKLAVASDGQATLGNTVAKATVNKLRLLADGKVIVGFAGATADAFALLERLDEKLSKHSGNVKRATVELAKDWRTDRYLRRLEAMLIVGNPHELFVVSGAGDVIEPDQPIAAIGSGGLYALSAATALLNNKPEMDAASIVTQSMKIAADLCIYTNHHLNLLQL